MSPADPEDDVVDRAYRFLRGHYRGELRFDERVGPVRYVVLADGSLVLAVEPAMLEAVDTVLFVPEEADDAMEIALSLEPLDPDGPDGGHADRWRIHHGEPPHAAWATAELIAARFEASVIDGPALARANPLADDEPRLCREINTERRSALHAVCRAAGAEVEEPLLVGIDPLGFDVRRRFDVVRVPVAEPMRAPDDVRAAFDRLAGEAAAGGPAS